MSTYKISTSKTYSVAIIGAGPGGLAAAYNLLKGVIEILLSWKRVIMSEARLTLSK
jgi:ribulose 1,5-bisphosphate synthetase/thiazole synthase